MLKRAYDVVNEVRIKEFEEAMKVYKQECALFQRFSRSIAPKDERTPEEIVAYEIARRRFSAAGKARYAAQQRFRAYNGTLREATLNQTLLQLVDTIQKISSGEMPTTKAEIQQRQLRSLYADDPQVIALREHLLVHGLNAKPEELTPMDSVEALENKDFLNTPIETTDEIEDFDSTTE